MFMLRINLFDLDYSRIQGFVDLTRQYSGKSYVNYPVFNVEDIVDLAPDCILMVADILNGESIISDFYAKKQISSPEVLYLFDKQSLDTLQGISSRQTLLKQKEADLDARQTNVLYAFYDLEVSPTTFDITAFLVLAELERNTIGCSTLHIIIVPSSDEGFCSNDLERYHRSGESSYNSDTLHWRLRNILVPCCWLIPSCQNITVCTSREEAQGIENSLVKHVFPKQYTVCSPVENYDAKHIIDAVSQKAFLPSIQATPQARFFVSTWIQTNVAERKLITINLRDCAYQLGKNSIAKQWGSFANSLDPAIYCPVVIRDIDAAFKPVSPEFKGIHIFPEIVWNLELRAALYELSYLNMFVGNGPDAMCCYNRKTRFIKLRTSASSLGGASEQYLKSCAMRSGTQLKWATPFQRLAWEDDKLEVLQRIFEEMCNKIDRFTSSGIEDLIATFNAAIKENNLNNAEWVSSLAVEQFPENSQAWLIRSKAFQLTNRLEDAIFAAKHAVLLKNHQERMNMD